MSSMTLVERHVVHLSHKDYALLDHLTFLSKNLYNATLYTMRQAYISTQTYLNYYDVNKLFTHGNQPDYRALPAKVAKQTQMLVDKSFKSFFALLKLKQQGKYDKSVRIPQYLHKQDGRMLVMYEKGALSFKHEGFIALSKTSIRIRTKQSKDTVQFVRIVPKGHHIVIEVGYKQPMAEKQLDNGRFASIDLGLHNLMTVASNCIAPFIINGKPLKAINHYYNKYLAKMKHTLARDNQKRSSKAVGRLTLKRQHKIRDYLHKVTTFVVNHFASHQITTLIVGCNKEWKQDIAIGKRNNQNFVSIPHGEILNLLAYKCEMRGITMVLQEESYTSKCSFFDDEPVEKHDMYQGKRIKRGLFRTATGFLLNADVNGACNIARKYFVKQGVWNVRQLTDCIKVCSTPPVVIDGFAYLSVQKNR